MKPDLTAVLRAVYIRAHARYLGPQQRVLAQPRPTSSHKARPSLTICTRVFRLFTKEHNGGVRT